VKKSEGNKGRGSAGIPVDSSGGPTFDPTKNVLDLVEAAVKRIDDLMGAQAEVIDSKIDRLEAIQEAESRHLQDMAALRTNFESGMRDKETERLDAIRAVDVQAVQRAAEVAEIRATALASQVAAAAEANRASVAATAAALESKLTTALEPLTQAIGELRRTQYEQQGQKTQQQEQRSISTDTSKSTQWIIATVISMIFGMAGLILAVAAFINKP
jgi:hypothetical protein